MNKEKLERICFNCNQFLPASMEEATEFGICLNDKDFEPFIEELLEKSNYSSCQELINSKKFLGEQEACEDFEEIESIEIDDATPLVQELKRYARLETLPQNHLRQPYWKKKLEILIGKPLLWINT